MYWIFRNLTVEYPKKPYFFIYISSWPIHRLKITTLLQNLIVQTTNETLKHIEHKRNRFLLEFWIWRSSSWGTISLKASGWADEDEGFVSMTLDTLVNQKSAIGYPFVYALLRYNTGEGSRGSLKVITGKRINWICRRNGNAGAKYVTFLLRMFPLGAIMSYMHVRMYNARFVKMF